MGFIHHQPLPQLRNHFNLFLFQPFNCFPPTKITNLSGSWLAPSMWSLATKGDNTSTYVTYGCLCWFLAISNLFPNYHPQCFQTFWIVSFCFWKHLSLFSGVCCFVCCGRLVANRRENLYFYNFHGHSHSTNMTTQFCNLWNLRNGESEKWRIWQIKIWWRDKQIAGMSRENLYFSNFDFKGDILH